MNIDDVIAELERLDADPRVDASQYERACAKHVDALLAELRELRAYKQQVERVKTCDDAHCFGGVRMEMNGGDAGSVGACAACGGLPE